MKKFSLPTTLLLLGSTFVFIKIYHQNCIIGLRYERQRLERRKIVLKKEANSQHIALVALKNSHHLRQQAIEARGMSPLNLAHLITFTSSHAGQDGKA